MKVIQSDNFIAMERKESGPETEKPGSSGKILGTVTNITTLASWETEAPRRSSLRELVLPSMDDYLDHIYPAAILFHTVNCKITECCQNPPGTVQPYSRSGIDIITEYLCEKDRAVITAASDAVLNLLVDMGISLKEHKEFLDKLPLPYLHSKTDVSLETSVHGSRVKSVQHLEKLPDHKLAPLASKSCKLMLLLGKMVPVLQLKVHFPVCFFLRTKLRLDFGKSRGQHPLEILEENANQLISYIWRGQYSTLAPILYMSSDMWTKSTQFWFAESFPRVIKTMKVIRTGKRNEYTLTCLIDDVPYVISFSWMYFMDERRNRIELNLCYRMYVESEFARKEATDSQVLVSIPFLYDDTMYLRYNPDIERKFPFDLLSDCLQVLTLNSDPYTPCCRCSDMDYYNGLPPKF